MKYQLLRMALAVPLLLLCAWPRTSVAQAAIADSVLAWGLNDYGQTTIPLAAQSGVSAIAAGSRHTVALVIPTAPAITTQPADQAVNVWQSASFTVVATGYQGVFRCPIMPRVLE